MLKRIGGWNYAGVVIIAGTMGFFSLFSQLTTEEQVAIRGSWWGAFFGRQLVFTLFSFIALCLLLLFNVIGDLSSHGEVNWRKLLDIIFFGMITCFMVTLIGNLTLMSL